MPGKKYFLNLTGAVLLGIVTLVVAAVAVLLMLPLIMPFFAAMLPFIAGALLVIVAIVVVWMLLYAAATVGVAVYYALAHPMQVNRESPPYDIGKVSESGLRQKGGTARRNKKGK